MTPAHAAALAELYRHHQAQLRRAIDRNYPFVCPGLRQDAIAFAWLQLCRRPREWIDPARDPVAWLYVVARRELLLLLRKQGRVLSLERGTGKTASHDDGYDAAWDFPARDNSEACERLREIRAAIDSLGRAKAAALTAQMIGLTMDETVRATGRSYTWVDRNRSRGKALLRRRLAAAAAQ